jgi:transposase-like protein
MKKRIWSIEEKVAILKEVETGGVVETCRKHGIYATTYYSWKKKYDQGGEAALENRYSQQEKKDLKKTEMENLLLKKILAVKELELQIKTELLKKKTQQWKNLKR